MLSKLGNDFENIFELKGFGIKNIRLLNDGWNDT